MRSKTTTADQLSRLSFEVSPATAFRRRNSFPESPLRPGCYCGAVFAHNRPYVGAKHDQSKLPASQVLLIHNVLIGRNHHIKFRVLTSLKKLAVFKLGMPLHLHKRAHFMPGKKATHANRNILIKQDAQRGGSVRRPKSL